MPLTLLDEVPPAGSVPVLGLLRIHRHEGHATSLHNPGHGARQVTGKHAVAELSGLIQRQVLRTS
jgi:hypothetical protein